MDYANNSPMFPAAPAAQGDDYEQLLELLSSPDLAAKLGQLGIYTDSQSLLGQQAKRGDEARNTPGAAGYHVAGTYVAANPLEHLGIAMQRWRGERDFRDATQRQQGLIRGKEDANRSLAAAQVDAMIKAMRQRQQQAAPADGEFIGDVPVLR